MRAAIDIRGEQQEDSCRGSELAMVDDHSLAAGAVSDQIIEYSRNPPVVAYKFKLTERPLSSGRLALVYG